MAKRVKPAKHIELNVTLPTAWSELTPEQVSRLAYHLSRKNDDTEFMVSLAIEFADLHPRGSRISQSGDLEHMYYHRDVGMMTLTADHFVAMLKVLDWVTKEPDPMAAPHIDGLTTPDKRLYGITLEQYITADSASAEFARSQNPLALRTMVAALYPRGEYYSPELLPEQAERISYLPVWHFEAVLLWFIGAKKYLMQKYPMLFTGEGAEPGAPISGVDTMLGILSAVNDGRVVDNQRLKQADVHEIFYELNNKIMNAQKNKK